MADESFGAGLAAVSDGLLVRGTGCFAEAPDLTVLGRIDMRFANLKRGEKIWFSIPATLSGEAVRIVGAAIHALDSQRRAGFLSAFVVVSGQTLNDNGFRAALRIAEALFETASANAINPTSGEIVPEEIERAIGQLAHIPPNGPLICDRGESAIVTIPADWMSYISLDMLMLLIAKRDPSRHETGYVLMPHAGATTIPAQALAQHIQMLFGGAASQEASASAARARELEEKSEAAKSENAAAMDEARALREERGLLMEEMRGMEARANRYQIELRDTQEKLQVTTAEMERLRAEKAAQPSMQSRSADRYASHSRHQPTNGAMDVAKKMALAILIAVGVGTLMFVVWLMLPNAAPKETTVDAGQTSTFGPGADEPDTLKPMRETIPNSDDVAETLVSATLPSPTKIAASDQKSVSNDDGWARKKVQREKQKAANYAENVRRAREATAALEKSNKENPTSNSPFAWRYKISGEKTVDQYGNAPPAADSPTCATWAVTSAGSWTCKKNNKK